MIQYHATQAKCYRNGGKCLENDVLRALQMRERAEAVRFLKQLWSETPTPCPKCGAMLTHLHPKAKKSNCDWKCPKCGSIYKTIRILDALQEP